jgi:hypothetical protein
MASFDFEALYRDLKEQERLSPQPVQAPQESPAGGHVKSARPHTLRR